MVSMTQYDEDSDQLTTVTSEAYQMESLKLKSAYVAPVQNGKPNSRRMSVNLSWTDLDVATKNGKQLLHNLSGKASAGELTAIMGPSGAGKTTLLNILSGFKQKHVSGSIMVNGCERDMQMFRNMSSYIMQDDQILPYLTVKECMYFASNLKVADANDREKVVEECLLSLGLYEHQYTKASNLSGGQRKRLCIAQELVSDPPILFLDEPTSGLDSSSSLHCIQLMKTLAVKGRTIICTIHQPSARVIEIFDKLYMLAEGQCIYRGPTQKLVPFLEQHGLPCPQYHNPTDFLIEVASREHGNWNGILRAAVEVQNKKESYDSPLLIDESISLLKERAQNKANALKSCYSGYATSSWHQLKILFHRSFICSIREPMAFHFRFAAHVVVGVLLGVIYYGIGNDATKIFNNNMFLYFSHLFLILTAQMPTILTFPLEKTIYIREYMNNWYNAYSYYLAKTLSDIPFQIVFPVIYCFLVYWMSYQPPEFWRFALFVLSSVVISLVSQSLGQLIGASVSVPNAVFIAPVLSVPLLLFSGFFVALKDLPWTLRWVSSLSYIRFCYSSIMLSTYSFDRPDLDCRDICLFRSPKAFLKLVGMDQNNLYVDYAAAFAFFVVYRYAAYRVLYYHANKRR